MAVADVTIASEGSGTQRPGQSALLEDSGRKSTVIIYLEPNSSLSIAPRGPRAPSPINLLPQQLSCCPSLALASSPVLSYAAIFSFLLLCLHLLCLILSTPWCQICLPDFHSCLPCSLRVFLASLLPKVPILKREMPFLRGISVSQDK